MSYVGEFVDECPLGIQDTGFTEKTRENATVEFPDYQIPVT